jgi:hypothetical protein
LPFETANFAGVDTPKHKKSIVAEEKLIRLGQASRKLNVGHNTILEFLGKKGFTVENNPNAKLTPEQFAMLSKEYWHQAC